ncbi:MAG: transposase [Campylobacterales bacterium]|nr:transposase [Campylobacterales bacterium]
MSIFILSSVEFKIEAVKQVTVNGYSIKETAERLGVNIESLRNWVKKFESPEAIAKNNQALSSHEEIKSKKSSKELQRSATF